MTDNSHKYWQGQYTLRLTMDDLYPSYQGILDILKGIPRIPYLLVALETTNRPHLHVILRTPMCRAWVYNIKKKYFPLWKSKKNEVWATHSCTDCKTHFKCMERAVSYVCKDGNILYQRGFEDDEIADAIELGNSLKPKKKQKVTIAQRIIKLIEPPLAEGSVPSGEQILNAMILFYENQGKYIPSSFHTDKTLHQIAMLTNAAYRHREYTSLRYSWDNGTYTEN